MHLHQHVGQLDLQNSTTKDFASVIRQIEDTAIFAGFIGQTKLNHDMVYVGKLMMIHNVGFFSSKLKNWYKKPQAQANRTFS
eukprot:scaffold114051_cov73-Cyclotella_meneghiniana.AAC.4